MPSLAPAKTGPKPSITKSQNGSTNTNAGFMICQERKDTFLVFRQVNATPVATLAHATSSCNSVVVKTSASFAIGVVVSIA
jgi:hypothetical protein